MGRAPGTQQRGRGRPRRTDAERDRIRAVIIGATEQVFAAHGYHGVTAAKIVEELGIARSHYYRHFPNAAQPLKMVLDRFGASLVDGVRSAVADVEDPEIWLLVSVQAYLDWATAHRTLLPSYTAALHDPSSGVSEVRDRTTAEIGGLVVAMLDAAGRPLPSTAEIDVFLSCCEYTSFRLHTRTAATDDDVDLARSMMIRAATALLGDAVGWRRALDVPGLVRPA